MPQGSRRAKRATLLLSHAHNKTAPILPRTDSRRIRGFVELCVYHVGTSFVFDMSSPDIEIDWAQHVTGWEFLLIGDSLDFLGQVHNRTSGDEAREACLRIVDVRGIMGRACAKQWGAHGDGSCKWACAKQLDEH